MTKILKTRGYLGALMIVLIAAGILIGTLINQNIQAKKPQNYYAVFTTNDQVYFGKLYNQNDQYVQLKNVYFLQRTTNPNPTDKNASNTQFNAVKLESEIYGPKNEMSINRDHIIHFEQLSSKSNILQTIKKTK